MEQKDSNSKKFLVDASGSVSTCADNSSISLGLLSIISILILLLIEGNILLGIIS